MKRLRLNVIHAPVSVSRKNRVRATPSLFEKFEQYSLALYAEGRQINLLDWSSLQVKYDADYAVEFFSSGNAINVSVGPRSYTGYIAPIYGAQVVTRTPTGLRTMEQDPGIISILSHVTEEHPRKPENKETLELLVLDEYGTAHSVRINPDIAKPLVLAWLM